jgi:hypothetical protein
MKQCDMGKCQCSRCRICPNRMTELSFSSFMLMVANQEKFMDECVLCVEMCASQRKWWCSGIRIPFRVGGNTRWGTTRPGQARSTSLQHPRMLQKWRKLFMRTDVGVFIHYQHNLIRELVLCTQSCNAWNITRCVPMGPTNTHRWSQAAAYGTITGALAVLPGRGWCIYAMECGRWWDMRHAATFNPQEKL